jgi:NADH-quinone oxidoreductase subunit L
VSGLAAVLPLLPLLGALGGFALSWFSSASRRFYGVPAPAHATDHTAGPTARAAGWVAIAPTALTALLTVVVAVGHGTGPVSQSVLRYANIGDLELWLGARVDGLAASVGVLVGVVALAVQVYSATYLRGDPRYRSYAAFVSLFTAAMLVVVYSADLLVMLVGWEIMGACSYFLIGHAWERVDARAAAVKAYLVTKAGDVPFLVGVIVLGLQAHTLRVDGVLRLASAPGQHHLTLATLLLLGGVVGKSAQFPLHSWLPDAMAGPTPISALIHAATMVAAGVFVVARLYPLFLAAPDALALLAALAAVTMVGAALAALAQDDIKRVLAYSTVSQLGYMAGALGVGDRDAAVFHLLSHGAFKALLFLGAGVLIHEARSNDMSVIGALQAGGAEPPLRRRMPLTFVTMTIGLAALAGVPPTSGFFSKEAVLGSAYLTAVHHVPGQPSAVTAWLVLVAGLLTALLTAAYTTRLWLRVFFGAGHGAARRPAGAVSPSPARRAGWRALTGEAPG